MAGLTWEGGKTPQKAASELNSFGARLLDQARALFVVETGRGVDMMKATIMSSTTPTGERRGSPTGRYETGNMYDEVDSLVGDVSETHITGEFGWLDPEKYFDYQENGTKHIEAMHALAQAENQVFDEVKAGLVDIMRGLAK